ncbi:hypothetical protein [Streptomyces poonensis]|uniref:Uncharacterized protein n=1 Tax=Streptomyces poonensis TaxID=68255 RepID=A0A918QCF9_9ACTN|nr:hypothetical protein [Streptomyces poonensis]GGZ39246.1 hypothetical protein GCM10010365_70000 [Streptomyces poonensis]GLJ93108.1 hypothetical protein GCM10017589_57200 [Streptomyces poonensis]
MNGFLDIAAPEPKPEFWYGLPHGYLKVDLQPSAERLQEMARQISELSEALRDRADQVFRLYAIVVTMLQKYQVQGCALGMHPNDNGSSSLSVLTVSTLAIAEGNPKAALTQLLAGAGTGPDNGIVPVRLPIGTGFLFTSERHTVAPTAPPEGQEGPSEGTVWQGTVVIPDTRSSSVITVQLVTPSVDLADDYRAILLGVARTVTFEDPAAPAERHGGTGPFAAPGSGPKERSPFG